MKIKWRQHELLLAGAILLLFIIRILLRDSQLSTEIIEDMYERPFRHRNFPFLYSRNVLLPVMGKALLFFVCFVYLNEVIVISLLNRKKTGLAIFHFILLLLLLGIGLSISHYLQEQYRYHSPSASNLSLSYALVSGFATAIPILVVSCLYALIREMLIKHLERDNAGRAYRIMISNRLSAATALFLGFFTFIIFFKLLQDRSYFTGFAFFVPAALLTYFINLYWFFPYKGSASFLRYRVWIRFVASLLAVSLPLDIVFVITMQKEEKFLLFLFVCTLIQVFFSTVLAWLVYSREKEKIEMLRGLQTELGRSEADLQFLRSQINPHFLFNALNTLYGTALQENAERTAEGVQKLGDMMRFMLHENTRDLISVQREIEYLENYISLQKLRTETSASIRIETSIVAFTGSYNIAPMLLIPFVENAFKHGISLEKPSFIKIVLQRKDNVLYFDVHNSIHHSSGKDTEKGKSGIGLQNVKQRLELLYPGRHELIVRESATEFFIHLTISLK